MSDVSFITTFLIEIRQREILFQTKLQEKDFLPTMSMLSHILKQIFMMR